MTRATREVGDIVLEVHRQCWRADAPQVELPLEDLVAVMPGLIRSGSVGLVWPRLRHRAEAYGAAGLALEEAFGRQAAHNARVEADIAEVVSRLDAAGIAPVLMKGLAVARLYPAGVVRTAGDIDLVVRDADYGRAMAILGAGAGTSLHFHQDRAATRAWVEAGGGTAAAIPIDLHGFSHWYGAADAGFLAEAVRVPVGEVEVLVPRVEDHVRALCLHFLRHGGVRPLRLCDIALLLETDAGGFDWERFLRGNRRATEQVVVTLRLAEALLGAGLDAAPDALRQRTLPGWLAPAVMRQWTEARPRPRPLGVELGGDVRNVIPALRRRWPDPVTATLRMGVPFNSFPRGPVVAAAFGRQMGLGVALRLRWKLDERKTS